MKMKKWDMIVLLFFLLLAGVTYYFTYQMLSKDGNRVIIRQDGKVIAEYALAENREVLIDNSFGKNKIIIQDGQVYIGFADCPDGTCVKHRPISACNEVIVCLPHKLIVEVVKADSEEVDTVATE